jgi:hypothetical protein
MYDDGRTGGKLAMNNEHEMKVRQRSYEIWEGENRPDGLAERHWLEAEREVTEKAENAATEVVPAQGTSVEKRTDAAKTVVTA